MQHSVLAVVSLFAFVLELTQLLELTHPNVMYTVRLEGTATWGLNHHGNSRRGIIEKPSPSGSAIDFPYGS